jgi:hypothetical protein
MKRHHTFTAGIILVVLALPYRSSAMEPPTDESRTAESESRGQVADELERIRGKYRRRIQKLKAAYAAEVKALIANSNRRPGELSGDSARSLAGNPAVVVFTQFRPNDGNRHVLHILASDGRSILIPYDFLGSMHGEWKFVPDGVEYSWKGRNDAGIGVMKVDPRHQRYVHSIPEGSSDELINASGSKVAGDMSFLLPGDTQDH